MDVYILVDRSGSMQNNWVETIGALNAYAETLKEQKATKSAKITVAAFDSQEPFKVIREEVKAKDWTPISVNEVNPRGMTPLFDAIGSLNQKIIEKKPKQAAIVIVTDGAENASREYKKETVKSLLDGYEKTGYDVTFIGADFDAFAQGSSLGTSTGKILNMTKGNYSDTFNLMAMRTSVYAESGAEAVLPFSDAERNLASKKSS